MTAKANPIQLIIQNWIPELTQEKDSNHEQFHLHGFKNLNKNNQRAKDRITKTFEN